MHEMKAFNLILNSSFSFLILTLDVDISEQFFVNFYFLDVDQF